MSRPSIDEVFRAVEAGTVEYGVVPVENSTRGRSVAHAGPVPAERR
ncbi:prephenate dehydratase domain-containing protein [Cupriavidus basilensis]